jgi:agmatine deiminase
MAWPTHTRRDLWSDLFDAAQREYAAVANAIAAFEPVVMVVDEDQVTEARGLLGQSVELLALPIDDSWVRDNGPIFVTNGKGAMAAVDFRFNGWGGRYEPFDKDDRLPAALADHFGVPVYRAPLVLEGGAISVDGLGTLITTESCLLNPNRNPEHVRAEIDRFLLDYLGAEVVIWLPNGWSKTRDTDGHVDGIALFTGPGSVLLLAPMDEGDPDHLDAAVNREIIGATPDASGGAIEVIGLDPGTEVEIPYANIYLANGAAIVPIADTPEDAVVRAQVAAALPGREIVPVPANVLHEGGGGPHCITQQVPTV